MKININPKHVFRQIMQWVNIKTIAAAVVVVGVAYWWQGFYRVQQSEQGIELLFNNPYNFDGEIVPVGPGLNWNWPWPIGDVDIVDIAKVHEISIGVEEEDDSERVALRKRFDRHMLTGDGNIASVSYKVQWSVSNPEYWFYKVQKTEPTIKAAAESIMREVVGKTDIDPVLTDGRAGITIEVLEKLQAMLDEYQTGVKIHRVEIQKSSPPKEVEQSYRDVETAKQDKEKAKNQALAHENTVIPAARGYAAQKENTGEASKLRSINEATGEADRIEAIATAFYEFPEITRERMFAEVLSKVFGNGNVTVLDVGEGSILPHLPVNQLKQ